MPPNKICLDFLPAASSFHREAPARAVLPQQGAARLPPEAQTNPQTALDLKTREGVCVCTRARGCSTCPKTLREVLEACAPEKERMQLACAQMEKTKAFIKRPASIYTSKTHCHRLSLPGGLRKCGFCVYCVCLIWAGLKSQLHWRFSPERSFLYFWTVTAKTPSTSNSVASGVKGPPRKVRSGKHRQQSCPHPGSACWFRRVHRTLITLAWSGLICTPFYSTNHANPVKASWCWQEERGSAWKDGGETRCHH